jgi:Bacteriophage baseplate protein W
VSANRALRFAGLGSGAGHGSGAGATPEAAGNGLATGATGALAMVDGDESVRQAIIMLLTTAPGERLLRPEYGAHLHRLIFAPNDRTTAGMAIHYVRSALSRWEPRVEIVDLDAAADPDNPAQLVISLLYRVRSSLTTDLLELTLELGGPS